MDGQIDGKFAALHTDYMEVDNMGYVTEETREWCRSGSLNKIKLIDSCSYLIINHATWQLNQPDWYNYTTVTSDILWL